MAAWRYYSNTAVADTLEAALANADTSVVAGSGNPQGYPQQYPWTLRLEPGTPNEELVSVTAGQGTAASPWTVVRAYDGTTAKAHAAGAPIAHGASAGDFTQAASHYAAGAGSGVHGLPASAWNASGIAKIQDTILANSTTSVVTFSNIPQVYSHLLLVGHGRLTGTSYQSDDLAVQFNGDTSASYGYITQNASNAAGGSPVAATGNGYAATSAPALRFLASQAGNAANAGGGFCFIPDYTSTVFGKLLYGVSGGGNGTSSFVDIRTRIAIWNPSAQAAITSLSLSSPDGAFRAGSRLTLYGIA